MASCGGKGIIEKLVMLLKIKQTVFCTTLIGLIYCVHIVQLGRKGMAYHIKINEKNVFDVKKGNTTMKLLSHESPQSFKRTSSLKVEIKNKYSPFWSAHSTLCCVCIFDEN